MRSAQSTRQWKILRYFEATKQGHTVGELAKKFDVSTRTIYRDLAALHDARFPLYTEQEGKNVYWQLMDGFKSGLHFKFSMTELMALHLSRDLLKVFEGTIFKESIDSLFDKVKTCLPKETIRYLDNVSHRVSVGLGPVKNISATKQFITQISNAVGGNKRIEISYRATSTGNLTTRKIDPYQVWVMNGGFYLIGFCHLRNSVRTFALERLKNLALLDESFHMQKDFSLEDYMQSAFRVMHGQPETVKVWISASVGHVVKERMWHPTQGLQELEDGSMIVAMEVPINYEVISWVLGFGPEAEVLEPLHLKEIVIEELKSSLQRYQSRSVSKTKFVQIKNIQQL